MRSGFVRDTDYRGQHDSKTDATPQRCPYSPNKHLSNRDAQELTATREEKARIKDGIPSVLYETRKQIAK